MKVGSKQLIIEDEGWWAITWRILLFPAFPFFLLLGYAYIAFIEGNIGTPTRDRLSSTFSILYFTLSILIATIYYYSIYYILTLVF